jgi:hypothetical protein
MILNISSLKEHGWHKFSVACTNPSKANDDIDENDINLFLMGTIHESYQSENQTKQWYNEISGSGE